jgi:hypothetical protein
MGHTGYPETSVVNYHYRLGDITEERRSQTVTPFGLESGYRQVF